MTTIKKVLKEVNRKVFVKKVTGDDVFVQKLYDLGFTQDEITKLYYEFGGKHI